MEKISAVYKILNTVTGDFYIGSSRNILHRWADHKCPSIWKKRPNNKMYQDMQKYGVDKFTFQIVCSIMPECLKQVEQDCIQMMKPTYNDRRANGIDVEKIKKAKRKYKKSEKGKEANRRATNKYRQLCSYNGETLKLGALSTRFRKAGILHPYIEAKKYLIK